MSFPDEAGDKATYAEEGLELELRSISPNEIALLLSEPTLPPGHPERLDEP